MVSRASLAATVLLLLAVSGCAINPSHWRPASPPAPQNVQEVVITRDGVPATYPQHWRGDTLLVDLQGVSGQGGLTLWPREGSTLPVRLAFQVTPGSIGVLEIRANQRSVLPIADGGRGPIELELDPGVYSPAKTTKIAIAWGPAEPVSP
jgi:hypothetical protein